MSCGGLIVLSLDLKSYPRLEEAPSDSYTHPTPFPADGGVWKHKAKAQGKESDWSKMAQPVCL